MIVPGIDWAEDRLTLDHIETRCRFYGFAGDAFGVERRLDAVARDGLAGLLATMAVAGPDDREGVIRIDRLELDLVLTREALDSTALARLWAERIGHALSAVMKRGSNAGIVRFADHAAFVAAYLEQRFGVMRHPDFAFRDFAALEHLALDEVAAELFVARPIFLPALARSAAGGRDPAWLARRLRAETSARILDAQMPGAISADDGSTALVHRLLSRVPPGWCLLPGASAALALLLASLAEGDSEAEVSGQRAAIARAIAVVARTAATAPMLLDRLEAGGKADGEAEGEVGGDEDAAALLSFPADERHEARIARSLFAGAAGRDLAKAVRTALGLAVADDAGTTVSPEQTRPVAQPGRDVATAFHSPFAGLVLLLPAIRALAIDRTLDPAQARALIRSVLAAPEREAMPVEALIDLLLPFPIEPDGAAWPRAVADDPDSAEAGAWTQRLLGAFAERLPGLQASSTGYLRRQFLHLPGTLTLDRRSLTARLVRPPLAIVLSIAGMTGEQGALPWRRERSLQILIP